MSEYKEYKLSILGSRRYAVNYKGVLVGAVHKGDHRDGESKNRWYVDGQKTKFKRREHAIAFLAEQYHQSQNQISETDEPAPVQNIRCSPDIHADLKWQLGRCAGTLMVWKNYAPKSGSGIRRNLYRCRRHAEKIAEHYALWFNVEQPFVPVQ